MELTAPELWSQVLSSAKGSIPPQSYETWLSPSTGVALTENELVVEGPTEFHVQWMEDKFGAMLQDVAQQVVGRPLRLTFRCSAGDAPAVPSVELADPSPGRPGVREPAADRRRPGPDVRPGLNDRYTFGRFVVGNNNQLASAACHAVAEKPARMYNPLFLYGGVGLGKTHLMHAIGNAIVERSERTLVSYVSSEQFTNQLVQAIQDGTTAQFRRRFREMDLLLVDDIHFLEGKERTQEEFFHTFNALYDAQKQIVLTSDRPPKEISGLEDRLVSRFEWGLVADIKPPDYETRVAILRKKADDDKLTLEREVIEFIARSCTASVRELEGAVIKLLAFSSLTNQEIDVELARRALSGMLGRTGEPSPRERLTPERVRDVVARHWNVKPAALESRRRTKDVTEPRQVAMYLIKDILDTSLVQIGAVFGGRDHSTVIHSVRKVEDLLENDPDFRKRVEAARADLVGGR